MSQVLKLVRQLLSDPTHTKKLVDHGLIENDLANFHRLPIFIDHFDLMSYLPI